MPTRRLDDRIRLICATISALGPAATDEEIHSLLEELLAAIHQKVERLRIKAVEKLLQHHDANKKERRMIS